MNCIICGNEFVPTRKGHVCCSRRCRDKNTLNKKVRICLECGKEYTSQSNTNFCSEECKHNYKISKWSTKTCEYCGNKYLGDTHARFCCDYCKQKYHKINDWQEEYVCSYCGKKYIANKYNLQQNGTTGCNFCSHQCIMAYLYQNNIITAKYSAPHKNINNILEELDIPYENEYVIDKYALDIKLLNIDKGIEVMGTYWHADNRKYSIDELEKRQLYCINKDKRKQNAINELGIDILYLWQYDIENNIELCKKLILAFYDNELVNNQHSSSYILENEQLKYIGNSQYFNTITVND